MGQMTDQVDQTDMSIQPSLDPIRETYLVGLLMECPVQGGNPSSCPLFEKRKLPMVERYEWSKTLSHEEATDLFRICARCSASSPVGVKHRFRWSDADE